MYIALRPHQRSFLSLIPERSTFVSAFIRDPSEELEKRFHDKYIGGYRSENAVPYVPNLSVEKLISDRNIPQDCVIIISRTLQSTQISIEYVIAYKQVLY